MKNRHEILKEIMLEYEASLNINIDELELINRSPFWSTSYFTKEELIVKLDSLIAFMESKQKDNTIYKMSCEELNNFWMDRIYMLKEHLSNSMVDKINLGDDVNKITSAAKTRSIVDSLRGRTFTPEEAAEIKLIAEIGSKHQVENENRK